MDRAFLVVLTLILASTIALFTLNLNQTNNHKDFDLWKTSFNKQYTAIDQQYRIRVWKSNKDFIEKHNRQFQEGLITFQLALNQFADLTSEEFTSMHLMKQYSKPTTLNVIGPRAPTDNIPAEIDWSNKGGVTRVKNQGQCGGGSWAFATTGALQGAHFIKQNKLESYSQQQLIDCSTSTGNIGCEDGMALAAYRYVMYKGITTERMYPFIGRSQTCKYQESTMKKWTIRAYAEVQWKQEELLMATIAQQPVVVAVQASSLPFQLYRQGVFSVGCGDRLDHQMLAVGYGVYSGDKHYKLKNSWGPTWGMNGYMLLLRNGDGNGTCGVQLSLSYPIA